MTLQLALADGRRANIQFQGTMDEAYKAYDGAPFRLDGTESTVCGIRYLPDPVDIREQNVTACFLDDLATAIVFCADFRLHLATYYQNQMGHKIVCTLPSGRQITKGTLFRPKVLLIPGYINVPDDVLYEPIPAALPMKQSRYGAYDPRNLDLIADWCRKLGYHYKFI